VTFRIEKHITRAMLRANPATLFVFGDNYAGIGRGGQAKEMRGEPNAVGIPTKWAPHMREDAFFKNEDLEKVRLLIDARFTRLLNHIRSGNEVVWPADGIGTGLAELQARAPKIWALIEHHKVNLIAWSKA
jgi:hypothetical protein